MTVSTTAREASSACNGVTMQFPAGLQFISNSDLFVYLADSANGALADAVLLTEGVDYSITGNGRVGTAMVLTVAAYPPGKWLRRFRRTARLQQADYVPNDGFPADAHETQLDRLTLVDQEIAGDLTDTTTRALMVPAGDVAPPVPSLPALAGKALGVGAGGSIVGITIGDGNDPGLRDDLAASGGMQLVTYKAPLAGAAARSGRDKLGDIVSALDIDGVVADGATDISAKLQAAINALSSAGGGTIQFPEGAYNLGTSTLVLQEGVSLVGNSPLTRLVYNGTGKAVALHDTFGAYGNLRFQNFTIDGVGADALFLATEKVGCYAGLGLDVSNIWITGTWTNGATYANMYNSRVSRVSTNGATITNACHRILATCNGMVFDRLYHGGPRGHLYGIYVDQQAQAVTGGDLPPGHDVTLLGCVAQGGKYGFYVRHARGLNIITPYTEACANPIVIGEVGAPNTSSVIVSGGGLQSTSDPAHPYYADRGPQIHVENANRVSVRDFDALQAMRVVRLVFSGGGGSGAAGVAILGRDGKVDHAVVVASGTGYTSAPSVTEAKTGSTYTAVLDSNQQVVAVTVDTVGTTALTGNFPAAITIGESVGSVLLESPYPRMLDADGVQYANTSIPLVAMTATGINQGLRVIGDVRDNGSALDIRKVNAVGRKYHVSYIDDTGATKGWLYEMPVVAAA
ncbi:glycosyl hydrolase family 28-related protein [Sphingomonas flavalba]|uniref:glycosyl hydrolase family 28-related protein n=1 Tax=Sphingomonas flavalba TaxID=2559804 RepID=UPI0039DF9AA9